MNCSRPAPHLTVVLLIQSALCVTAVLTVVVLPHSADVAAILPICVGVTAMFGWSLWSWWYITGSFVDPYLMFMTSLFLFNAGQAPLEVLGLNKRGMLGNRFDDETLVATLLLVGIGLSVTHLGALLAVRLSAKSQRRRRAVASDQALTTIGWILLGVSGIPSVLLLIDALKTVVAGGYMSLYQAEASTGVAAGPQVLAMFLVPAAMFLLAGAHERRREKLAAAIVIGGYATIQLSLGIRSTAIMAVCAFAWLWDRLVWKIKFRWVAAAALFALTVSAVSADIRGQVGVERFSLTALAHSYTAMERPVVSTISEMGGSMAAVAYTYVLVPSNRPFDNGVSYAYALLTVMPSLFWSIHPTIAHGTVGEWLVWSVDPSLAGRQGGLGYSCIAEAYLNFGWPGVIIIMTLVGFGAGRLGIAEGRVNVGHLAVVASFAAFALKFPRDESASLVRAFVWYAFLPYATAFLMTRLEAVMRPTLSLTPTSASPSSTMAVRHGAVITGRQ
jgi:oligosaccharide repeat unit polymerase